MRRKPLTQLLLVISGQMLAWAVVWLGGAIMPALPAASLLLQGLIASLLGRLLGLPYWWAPINLILPLAGTYLLLQFR